MNLPQSAATQTLNQEENKMKWIPKYSPYPNKKEWGKSTCVLK
jgi:hypothetical protein